jgi:cytidine deaminase
MKNGVFWDVTPCCSCRKRLSEELNGSFNRVTIIGEPVPDIIKEKRVSELETTLAIISLAACFGC